MKVEAATSRRRAVGRVTEIEPACAQPALLVRSARPAPNRYIVIFIDGIPDARQLTAQLASKYQFEPKYVWVGPPFQGFAGILSEQAVAGIRCEPTIARVEQDGVASFP
jgi:hypothetical protein